MNEKPTPVSTWNEFQKAVDYNNAIELYETVKNNENFFIGKQWEGVESNGLPTPVFNFIKRVVLFLVASVVNDNVKIQAASMDNTDQTPAYVVDAINAEFEKIFENSRIISQIRELMRNAAVDGDGCLYTWLDPGKPAGGYAKGAIVSEVTENTRVLFGNPSDRRVERQPYIIIMTRELVSEVRRRAKLYGGEADNIQPDSDYSGASDGQRPERGGDKCTVLLRLSRNPDSGIIGAFECTQNAVIRPNWNTGLTLYPITWLCWDFIQNSYHGAAVVSGLIPNQVFVNKLYAMAMISLMTTAYPKVIYDKTRIESWDNRVGAAVGVLGGGDIDGIAKIIDPAHISPQVSQFIDSAINYTKDFMGATDAALGDVRPDNTSAIIAVQRASQVPMELVRQNMFQLIEDFGRICIDHMAAYYGSRLIRGPDGTPILFDFSQLRNLPVSLKLDVGASAFWSEIASMQTLDNLLMNNKIELIDYLERLPNGYIPKKQELIEKVRNQTSAFPPQGLIPPEMAAAQPGQSPGLPPEMIPELMQ